MKPIIDWQDPKIVNIFDELSLWSSFFGRLLLENIPMREGMCVLDLGFGTGFPLVELAQRFGAKSKIIGMDIWESAINRTERKLDLLGLENVSIIQGSAEEIPLKDDSVDIVVSNLGINNFENRSAVYSEINRVLKPEAELCLTTNPIGTFKNLFSIFLRICVEMGWADEAEKIKNEINRRGTAETIIQEMNSHGLELTKRVEDRTSFRFVDAGAVLDHCLIRIGFRQTWDDRVGDKKLTFYRELHRRLEQKIEVDGEFCLDVPVLYLSFKKWI